MLILGLNIGHDPSAALVDGEGRVLAAAHEARLTRIKKERRFPHQAIRVVLTAAAQPADAVRVVAYSSYQSDSLGLVRDKYLCGVGDVAASPQSLIATALNGHGIERISLVREDHHFAHACAARLAAKPRDVLIVTADGYGDGISFTVRESIGGLVPPVARLTAPIEASLGLVFQYVTGGLGFSMLSEEWKTLGLEPFGREDQVAELFDDLIEGDGIGCWRGAKVEPWAAGGWADLEPSGRMTALRRYFELRVPQFDRVDVARGVQCLVERRLVNELTRLNPDPGTSLALGGGLFLNVRLNRILSELGWVRDVSVFPAAGDGGNAVGAALAYLHRRGVVAARLGIADVYWGHNYDPGVASTVERWGVKTTRVSDDEAIVVVARAVVDGRIVAIARGRGEFGPRALLSRSLICRADRSDLTDLLTDRLGRDPIMPYGCSILAGDATGVFCSTKALEQCLRFMIAAPIVRPEFAARYRPVCHPVREGGMSTRPHIVAEDDSWPSRLLTRVRQETGCGIVLNTSFNLHGEPIVESPDDALVSFSRMDVPGSVLLLGDHLVSIDAVRRLRPSLPARIGAIDTQPRRRREATPCVIFAPPASHGVVISGIADLGLRLVADVPVFPDEVRRVSRTVREWSSTATSRLDARAVLAVGTDSASVLRRWVTGLGGLSATVVLPTCNAEAQLQIDTLFPHTRESLVGAYADLLLWPGEMPVASAVTLIGRTTSLSLAGLLFSLDEVSRQSNWVGRGDGPAVVFGTSVRVRRPLGGRMLMYAPEGLAALKKLVAELRPAIDVGDFLECRQQGLVLAFLPPTDDLGAIEPKVRNAMEWHIDAVVATAPAISLTAAELLEEAARCFDLAIIGGSDGAVPSSSARQFGVNSAAIGRFLNRFPGLEV